MVVDIKSRCYLQFLSAVLEEECSYKNEAQKFFETDDFQIMKKYLKYFLFSKFTVGTDWDIIYDNNFFNLFKLYKGNSE